MNIIKHQTLCALLFAPRGGVVCREKCLGVGKDNSSARENFEKVRSKLGNSLEFV